MALAFLFDRFRLDPRQRLVFDGGAPLTLGARAFDLLLALVEHPDRALTRDELFARAWPDRVVADENLKMQVMALRRALGAAVIVTVPRVGYRIGCDVRQVEADERSNAASPAARGDDEPPPGLLGRQAEWQQARAALASSRLVTLTGPGGVGKTRLALALAEAQGQHHADGVLILTLADHAPGSSLPRLLASAARLAESPAHGSAEGIARALRTLSLRVLLDNCEHVHAAAAELAATLLQHAPDVWLLTTSQEPLGLPDEQVITLTALPAQAADGGPGPAMQLFAERAARADPAFRLDAERLPQVAAICQQLDGLPLAIELAAARVPLLGVAGVHARLHAPMSLLAGGVAGAPERHRALRNALRWSVELLDEAERRLYMRLGVFVGGFDLDAVIALEDGGDEFVVIDRLASLVGKSLVQAVEAPGGGKRYRLLEGARAYALELLRDSAALAAACHDHARCVAQRFEAAELHAFGTPLLQWTDPLMPELPNLRAALAWALSDEGRSAEPLLAVRLMASGTVPWTLAGLDGQARELLERATALLDEAPPALAARGWLAVTNRGTDLVMPPAVALAAARRAAALFREVGDAGGTYRSLAQVLQHGHRTTEVIDTEALLAEMRALESPAWTPMQLRSRRWAEARAAWRRTGDWAAHRDSCRREALLCREAGNQHAEWLAMHQVVLAELLLGHYAEAAALATTVVEEIRAAGHARRQWAIVALHAMACICTGNLALSIPAVRTTLPLLRLADAVWWLGDHLGWWLAQMGHVEAAARAVGWMAERRRQGSEPPTPQSRPAMEAVDSLLRARLDDARRAACLEAGAAERDDDIAAAVMLALESQRPA